jgi:hypothetical protein
MSTGDAESISQTIDKAGGPGMSGREGGWGCARAGRPTRINYEALTSIILVL